MNTKHKDLYLQVWINPISQENLLAIMGPASWQTLTALAVHINEQGSCDPSLYRLQKILGLSGPSAVSRRIKQLEKLKFQGNPILLVQRSKRKNDNGSSVYARNRYQLNPKIVTIFQPHDQSLGRQKEQMRIFLESRHKSDTRLSSSTNEINDNITRASNN